MNKITKDLLMQMGNAVSSGYYILTDLPQDSKTYEIIDKWIKVTESDMKSLLTAFKNDGLE